ncbi:unnamed protein product [Lupinus luteus]|uniref:Uncharacterized protein n=1 Tax=Lupinus luteus TaxID=3873 RepID=A0AAV1WIZ6_LUPLU
MEWLSSCVVGKTVETLTSRDDEDERLVSSVSWLSVEEDTIPAWVVEGGGRLGVEGRGVEERGDGDVVIAIDGSLCGAPFLPPCNNGDFGFHNNEEDLAANVVKKVGPVLKKLKRKCQRVELMWIYALLTVECVNIFGDKEGFDQNGVCSNIENKRSTCLTKVDDRLGCDVLCHSSGSTVFSLEHEKPFHNGGLLEGENYILESPCDGDRPLIVDCCEQADSDVVSANIFNIDQSCSPVAPVLALPITMDKGCQLSLRLGRLFIVRKQRKFGRLGKV